MKKKFNFVKKFRRSSYLGSVESKSILAELHVGNATCFNCPLSGSPITLHHVIFCLICHFAVKVYVSLYVLTLKWLKRSSLRHLSACQYLDQYEYRFLLTLLSYNRSWSEKPF